MKALPKVIFVKREQDGDATYLLAGETQRELAEMNERITVGKYQLIETAKVEMVAQITVMK